MSAKLNEFGRFTRKLRVDQNEFLKDMAKRLGVTASYLSAVETGKRNPPQDWVERLQASYNLSNDDTAHLEKAASDSRVYDKLDIAHLPFEDKRLIVDVVKCLPSLTPSERSQLNEIVSNKQDE